MVKITLKGVCLLAAIALAAATAHAELLLNENFDYEAGNLYNQGGWVKFGGQTNKPIQIVEGNLVFDGYQSAAVGKMAKADCEGEQLSNQDLHRAFEAQTSGCVYMSALVNVQSALGDQFFLCFDGATKSAGIEDGIATANNWRLFVSKGETDGKIKFGLGKNKTASSVQTSAEYDISTTYLVVLKYEFITGAANDNLSLYINQTGENEPSEPLITTNAGTDAYTTDNGSSYDAGIGGVVIMQNGSDAKPTPTFTIDAVRVATTWAELFDQGTSGGDEPNPTKPAITAPAAVEFGSDYYVLTGEPHTQTITVKGSDLEGDVKFAVNCDQITLSATSAAKEQVMSKDGFELTLTLTATGAACEPKLTIGSTNATTVEVPIAWTLATTIDVADMAALRAAAAAANLDDEPLFRLTSPIVVSYQDGTNYIYLQDDKGGIRMKDEHGLLTTSTFATSTKLASGLFGTVADNFGYYFIPYRDIATDGTAEVNAVTATLAEIDADKSAYVDRLVRVEHVQFAQTGTFGTAQVPFNQNGTEAKLRLFGSVADIAGRNIPPLATVVGISTSTSALLIAPRAWSDITSEEDTGCSATETNAAICYANDGTLYVEHANAAVAVYNLTGICVAKAAPANRTAIALPQGIYAVKIDGKTHKVIVK